MTTQERDSVIALLSTLPPEIFTLLLVKIESADNNETQLITPTAESAFPEKKNNVIYKQKPSIQIVIVVSFRSFCNSVFN